MKFTASRYSSAEECGAKSIPLITASFNPSAFAHFGKTFIMDDCPVVTPIKYKVGAVAFS